MAARKKIHAERLLIERSFVDDNGTRRLKLVGHEVPLEDSPRVVAKLVGETVELTARGRRALREA